MSVESSVPRPRDSAPKGAVFLSYASQDAEAAKRICDALRQAGVEVWFDTDGGLEHGDEWDAKIRRQIKECVLFLPIISANTQAREEGYFRLEWDLAVERARTIASGVAFILPVVVDETREPAALVPDRFRTVQWTKLPGGVIPPEVLQRFLKLWSHRTGVLKHAENVGRDLHIPPPSNEAGYGDPALQEKSPRWLPRVIGGVVVATIALLVARPWQATDSPRPVSRAERSAAAPASEARQLTTKAWALMNKPDLARAELEIADGYCKRATELDPNDADAWAAWSQVDSWTVYHNFDASPGRREAARSKATHAMQIAAAGYEPRLAQACFLVRGQAGGDATLSLYAGEAEKLLRALLQEKTDEPRALLALGILLRNMGRFPECRDAFNRMARDPAFAAQAWNELGWAEYINGNPSAAGPATDRSVALQPYWGNLLLKLLLAGWWRGDLDEAQATLERLPLASRQEDVGVYTAAELSYWRRDPQAMLRVLDTVPRDWLQSNGFDGPKAYWAAVAHRLAGHEAAAQLQWRTALAAVERRLAQQPDSALLIRWKGLLLAASGDRTAGEPLMRLAREMGYSVRNVGFVVVDPLALGDLDGALEVLERAVTEGGMGATAAAYRLNPDLDALRSLPRFQALLARMEADPRFSPKAAAKLPEPSAVSDQRSASGLTPQASNLTPSNPAAPDSKSVAVLAFANLSDDKSNEYFSDGISEELLNVLAKVPGLTVRGRSSGFYFKGKQVKSAEIGQQLNVSYLVQGSVRRSGDRVRISAQLIRAATDEVIWSSGSLDRDLKDIFAVQDEIAGLIAKNLSLKMGVTARPPHQVNPEALTALLAGRHFWVLRTTEGFARAGEFFNRAVAIDPDWAPAHAALASLLTIEASYRKAGGESVSEQYALAAREAKRAIELDPTLGEPHAALGKLAMEDRRLAEAEEEFRRALELEPNNALAIDWQGDLMVIRGRLDLAIAAYRRAAELEPLSPYILWDLAWELMHVRRFDEALALVERAEALTPAGSARLSLRRAQLLLELGRKAEAEIALRVYLESFRTGSNSQFANEAVWCLKALGSPAEREHWTTVLLRQYPDSFARGAILLMLGREEEAYRLLEKTPAIFMQQLYWAPAFDPVRDTPRFQQLLVKLGCAAEYKVARETQARMLKEQEAKK